MAAVCAGSLVEVLLDDHDDDGFERIEYRRVKDLQPGDRARGSGNGRRGFVTIGNVISLCGDDEVVALCSYLGLRAVAKQYVIVKQTPVQLQKIVPPVPQTCGGIMRVELQGSKIGILYVDGVACVAPPETRLPTPPSSPTREATSLPTSPCKTAVRLRVRGYKEETLGRESEI